MNDKERRVCEWGKSHVSAPEMSKKKENLRRMHDPTDSVVDSFRL